MMLLACSVRGFHGILHTEHALLLRDHLHMYLAPAARERTRGLWKYGVGRRCPVRSKVYSSTQTKAAKMYPVLRRKVVEQLVVRTPTCST